MRWGRVEVTGGFVLLMAWLNYTDNQGVLALALCSAAVHELGHWAAILLLGGQIRRLRLSAVGAELVLERSLSYGRELFCALAGPAVNVLLAVVSAQSAGERSLLFAGINLALALFNLLPLPPLDGGRALVCALSLHTEPDRARRLCEWVGRGTLGVLLLLGGMCVCRGGGITLPLCALWLFCTGRKLTEKRVAKVRGKG